MTASEVFELRTGKDGDDYISLAEQEVRAYLNYLDSESVDKFASVIGNIAVLFYLRDQEMKSVKTEAGVKSESFTEGKVSVHQDFLATADVSASYDEKVGKALLDIKRYRRAHIPTEDTNADGE